MGIRSFKLQQNLNPQHPTPTPVTYILYLLHSCGTQVYYCLPASWSGVCVLVFLFHKLGVLDEEEPQLILVMD